MTKFYFINLFSFVQLQFLKIRTFAHSKWSFFCSSIEVRLGAVLLSEQWISVLRSCKLCVRALFAPHVCDITPVQLMQNLVRFVFIEIWLPLTPRNGVKRFWRENFDSKTIYWKNNKTVFSNRLVNNYNKLECLAL